MSEYDPDLYVLPENDGALISTSRLPAYIGVSVQSLARWRCSGEGPPFLKVGRKVLYRAGDVRNHSAR